MLKKWNFSFFIFIFLTISIVVNCHLINQNVERNLDLSTQLVKESYKISVSDSSGGAVKNYLFVIPENAYKNLTYISIKDDFQRELKFKEKAEENRVYLTIDFLTPQTNQILHVEAIFSKCIKPHPAEIKQADKHLVKYTGNIYFLTPYTTKVQKTMVKLGTTHVLSYTQEKPTGVVGNKLKYGPYEDIQGFSHSPLDIHYENPSPFLTVTSLERIIEVSHWGNIAVKETIDLRHSGAKLSGPFSRYEFQKGSRSGQYAVESYKTILPASATSVYYRDINGNISTSNMRILRDSVELELKPRFPLFGGWKTLYTLGYNVPSFEYLYKSDDNYLLKMRIIDHIYDDMVVDVASIKIILPEGSSNIQLKTPYAVKRDADELHYTYLDTIGRPVISFSKTNLVENHIAEFELSYTFSSISLLQEPLLVISFIFAIFIIIIIFLRMDFSISTQHQHKE